MVLALIPAGQTAQAATTTAVTRTRSTATTYNDFAYTSYDAAIKAAIISMAKYNKPVGVLAWAGGHAQIINGYQVSGLDPATSSSFAVQYVYITDPLKSDAAQHQALECGLQVWFDDLSVPRIRLHRQPVRRSVHVRIPSFV